MVAEQFQKFYENLKMQMSQSNIASYLEIKRFSKKGICLQKPTDQKLRRVPRHTNAVKIVHAIWIVWVALHAARFPRYQYNLS